MRLPTLLLLPLLLLPQEKADLSALKKRLEEAMVARDDAPAFKALSEAVAAAKALLAGESAPLARTLLAVGGATELEAAWKTSDLFHRAAAAWIAGHLGTRGRIAELKKLLGDKDARLAFMAARSLIRLFEDAEFREFAKAESVRIARGGFAGGDGTAPSVLVMTARRDFTAYGVIMTAGPERMALYLHLLPESSWEEIARMGMGWLRFGPLPAISKYAEEQASPPEHLQQVLIEALRRLGGPTALFPAAASKCAGLRERAMRLLELEAAREGFWVTPWIAYLERPKLDVELAKWAHGVLRRLTGEEAEFGDAESAARGWRSWLKKNGRMLVEKHVNRAIDRGAAYLKKRQAADGSWAPVGAGGDGTGALALFTLLHAGAPLTDPAVQKGFAHLAKTEPADNIYQEGTVAMACARYLTDAPAAKGKLDVPVASVQARLDAAVKTLVRLQRANGSWAYGRDDSWDNSNLQVAMMGLAQAMGAGSKIDAGVWKRARGFLAGVQNGDGGWGYNRSEVAESYGSMTAASAFGVLLATKATAPKDFEAGLEKKSWPGPYAKAAAWFGRNLSIEKGHFPHPPEGGTTDRVHVPDWKRGSPYYWLYGLERLCLLAGLEEIAGRDWYTLGALHILGRQDPDGAWNDASFGLADTCFAILFLRRARIDVETPGGPRERSDDRPGPREKSE